jgi:anaerobic magnesium-protoporphyrin IX monomethyl ester cyclase
MLAGHRPCSGSTVPSRLLRRPPLEALPLKIVLYQPQQTDKRHGPQSSLDMIPLEMMHIAAFPLRDGHEVVLIDGSLYDQDDAHRRVVEACRGATIFGTTGILGWQVSDAYTCAEKVRAAAPTVKRVIGGWFASVMPSVELRDGVFEVVVLGQGELTFRDLVAAIDSGADLEGVAGLALWRDGAVHETEHRKVASFAELIDPAWHLIDFTPYREGQLRADSPQHTVRMPGPPWIGKRKPYVGITYFSSFGCPEPCSFCCSPFVTNRRWKAKAADKILDDLQMLRERWGGFDVVRFHDANFGVMQKRTREFAEGLLARDMKLGWNAFIETYSVNNYDESTLDLCAESGYYVAEVGAETGDPETMKRVGKPIVGDANFQAAARLHDRNIWASITYIIGFPYEPEESMLATIDEARRVQLRCPNSSTHVLPYRPIPGTKMFDLSKELGYTPPDNIHDWGNIGEYHLHQTWSVIPERVMRLRALHNHYTTLFKGIARKRTGVFEKLARWRLESDNLSFPLDAKLFHLINRVENKLLPNRKVTRDLVDQALG